MDKFLEIYGKLRTKFLYWMILPSQPEQAMPNYEGFSVIGAGLPRTGTSSLRVALEILLHGRCYHMRQMAEGGKLDLDHWQKVLNSKISDIEWREFFNGQGIRAAADSPTCFYFKYAT